MIELKDFKIIIDSDEEDSDLRYKAAECQDDSDMDPASRRISRRRWIVRSTETSRSGLVVTEPDISAKLKNGPLFLKIHRCSPDHVADLVAAVEDDDNTEGDRWVAAPPRGDDLSTLTWEPTWAEPESALGYDGERCADGGGRALRPTQAWDD